MRNGGFSVQLSNENTFGRIPVDQTLEETVNRDTQTPGGTKGFSLKPGAVQRYYLTAEFRTLFLRSFREMVGNAKGKHGHAEREALLQLAIHVSNHGDPNILTRGRQKIVPSLRAMKI